MRRRRDDSRKGQKFMVYLMGFIMVGSVFGVIFYGYGGGVNSIREKGFKFVDNGNYWETNVDGQLAIFTYLPSQVEPITIDDFVINRLKNVVQIDTTSDFNDTFVESIALAQFQMGVTLNNFGIFVRGGFTTENQDFPVLTCGDSTNFVPVIYFKSSNETNVYMEDNCIIAEALSENDVLGIKDRLVYGILGIIE